MRRSLLRHLRSPGCREPLAVYVFQGDEASRDPEQNVIDGLLVCSCCRRAYPIAGGVPVLVGSSFTREFVDKYSARISEDPILSKLDLPLQSDADWSFSAEWEVHFESGLVRTWGWTIGERVQQFFHETGTDPDWCKGKLILDAGCGNGQLSEALSGFGATVVGLDYSSSVCHAEARRRSANVHFVRGDLKLPPFDTDTFDLVVSNGVLHHTRDTYATFRVVAGLVKPGGRFYLWLYRKPENFFRRYGLYPALDLARILISRMPRRSQTLIVKNYARVLRFVHRRLGKLVDLSWQERVVAAYDVLTPLWRHYHTPLEVSYWFFMSGYSPPTVTHWDNPYGFGMVAKKEPQGSTPGVNFGRARISRRYWR